MTHTANAVIEIDGFRKTFHRPGHEPIRAERLSKSERIPQLAGDGAGTFGGGETGWLGAMCGVR